MQATCSVCSKPFQAQRSSAKFCGATCRKRASRQVEPPAVPLPTAPSADLVDSETPPLVRQVTADLTAAGRLATTAGQQALHLAGRITAATFDTGSAVASLHKQLSASMAEAVKGAQRVTDPVDELRARRDRKRDAG